MKALFLSFIVGLCVGAIYGLIRVKSPAPPIIALLGLLGMVIGEQVGTWTQAEKLDVSRAAAVCLVGERYDRHPSGPMIQRNRWTTTLAGIAADSSLAKRHGRNDDQRRRDSKYGV